METCSPLLPVVALPDAVSVVLSASILTDAVIRQTVRSWQLGHASAGQCRKGFACASAAVLHESCSQDM